MVVGKSANKNSSSKKISSKNLLRDKTVQLFIGSDHAGFARKQKLYDWLLAKGYTVTDCGNNKFERTDDYPDFAKAVALQVSQSSNALGILLCGSAQGVCIAANKVQGTRAVSPHSSLIASLSRIHDHANIICLPGGDSTTKIPVFSMRKERQLIETFLAAKPSQAARHLRRVNKITTIEREERRNK